MKSQKELISETQHLLPDLEELEKKLAEEPEKIISRAFPEGEQWISQEVRAIIPSGHENVEFTKLDTAVQEERVRIVDAARRAVKKIRKEGESADLTPDEAYGYEAIISMVGRPAILIQNGMFFPPPSGWEILETKRANIEKSCKSVGRIEAPGHPMLDWIGTGFLVAEDVVMTNKHVVKEFCNWSAQGGLVFEPGIKPRIDYVEELATPKAEEFAFVEVIGVHDTFDLALLKVSRESSEGVELPEPLPLATEVSQEISDKNVYVLGYPAWDPRRNDPEVMRRIFDNIYGVKRLQPGKIIDFDSHRSMFTHDCSTLGGNSGSCVIDIETNNVIGLHFMGHYLVANTAIALWSIKDDPLLQQAGVL